MLKKFILKKDVEFKERDLEIESKVYHGKAFEFSILPEDEVTIFVYKSESDEYCILISGNYSNIWNFNVFLGEKAKNMLPEECPLVNEFTGYDNEEAAIIDAKWLIEELINAVGTYVVSQLNEYCDEVVAKDE